jgi:hypothetical protein
MKQIHATVIIILTILAGSAALGAVSARAVQDKKADETSSVTGTWIMLVEGHQIGLVLEQDGEKITGTLMVMGREQPLEGTFVERSLRLVGVNQEGADESAGAPHGGGGPGAGPITAMMKDDGTLEGELSTNKGRMAWTGERLRKR